MAKKRVNKQIESKPPLKRPVEDNLLTVAENKMIEMLDSKKYKEVDEFYEFEASFIDTRTGTARPSHAKMDKTRTEVVEISRIASKGEFYGCKISYTVLKKRHKEPTTVTMLVAFRTEDMEVLDEPVKEPIEEQLSMF
ncbi:hypothetical protein QUF96_02195 [Bacillus bombysepticus]|nr:hypothetical protein [Bacillus bombysepticus]HDR4373485.1 hypothetical protein [Bacillus cereus]